MLLVNAACRNCGAKSEIYARGLDAHCYRKHRYAGTLEQFPAARPQRRRIVGTERKALGNDLAERYAAGENIRALAASADRSRSVVQAILAEAGVRLRPSGGGKRPGTPSHDQLVATLAARHMGERLTKAQATAALRNAHGRCSTLRADKARRQHNSRILR